MNPINPGHSGGMGGGMSRRGAIAAMGAATGTVIGLGAVPAVAGPRGLADPKVELEYGNTFEAGAPRPLVKVAGKNDMLVVYNVNDQNVSTVKYVQLEQALAGNSAPVCLGELPEVGDGGININIIPPPPWWRYTRGRWTHQRTERVDIVASGTTALILCCDVRDVEGEGQKYESEFVVLIGDAGSGKGSKLLVTALVDKSVTHELTAAMPANTNDATIDAYAKDLLFVRTDKNGKLTMPVKTSTFVRKSRMVLTDAVACVMKHVRDARKMELHLGGADSAQP